MSRAEGRSWGHVVPTAWRLPAAEEVRPLLCVCVCVGALRDTCLFNLLFSFFSSCFSCHLYLVKRKKIVKAKLLN